MSNLYDYTFKDVYNYIADRTTVDETVAVKIDDFTVSIRGGAAEAITMVDSGVKFARKEIGGVVSEGIQAATWTVQKAVTGANAVIGSMESTICEVVDYITPSSATLNTFSEIGKEMDDYIKSSLFLQFFGITREDILCSAFCFILSLLPCKTRNDLYNAVIAIQRQTFAANTAINAANDISTQINVGISGINSITQAAKGLINGNLDSVYQTQSTGMSAIRGYASVIASIKNIEGIVDTIKTAVDFINKGRILYGMIQYSNIWNLARAILFAFQSIAMQMADEALDRIFQPLEDIIMDIQPTNCMRNLGGIVFNKILSMIDAFKAWIVTLIGELFTEFYSYKKMMDTFNTKSKDMIYISMLIDSLKTLTSRFGDLSIICGLEPCYEEENRRVSGRMPEPQGRTTITRLTPFDKPEDNIDTLADTFKDIIGNIDDVFVTPSQIITVRNLLHGAPPQIMNYVDDINIGGNYTISKQSDHVKVIYTFQRQCGV